jgi:hypothetical protein
MMLSLTTPTDAAFELAQDLQSATGIVCSANAPAVVDGSSPVCWVTRVGCEPSGPTAWLHYFDVYVWAGGSDDYGPVVDALDRLAGAFSALSDEPPKSGRQWRDPTVTNLSDAYVDTTRTSVPRAFFACNAVLHGTARH